MFITKPSWYDAFSCLAGRCPDTCCGAWQVEIDERSLALYRSVEGPVGEQIRSALIEEDGTYRFAMNGGRCTLLTPEGLCAIQCILGEQALCRSCGFYPRFVTEIGARRELGLCLSCPEAARLILTSESFALRSEETAEPITAIHELSPELIMTLRGLRSRALELAADRSLPFGERCARILALCAPAGRARRDRDLASALEAGLAQSRRPAGAPDPEGAGHVLAALRAACADMEYLKPAHRDRMDAALAGGAGGWTECCPALPQLWENLLCYGICRYFPRAAFDRSVWPTAVLSVTLPLLLRQLLAGTHDAETALRTAWTLSRELEHSEENLRRLFRCFGTRAFRPSVLPAAFAAFAD